MKMEREKSSIRICGQCGAVVPYTFVHYSDTGETQWKCEKCSAQEDTNAEMIGLADLINDIKGEERRIGGFTFVISDEVPKGSIYIVPSRETLEKVKEEDSTADLRRYFGHIKNIGK